MRENQNLEEVKARVKKVSEDVKKIEEVQGVIDAVERTNSIISDTLYIKGGIAVDLKNSSLMSIPTQKELLR